MNTFFNFETGKSVNPLEKITSFYVSPYMPDNFKLLNLDEKLADITDINAAVTPERHVVTVFPINHLIKGDCIIKWSSEVSFCINGKIWCKIVADNCVRVDTVRF